MALRTASCLLHVISGVSLVESAPIYVSTGGFGCRPEVAIRRLREQGVTRIELSGGLPSAIPISTLIHERLQGALQIHNYFPPPEKPFVFNLADANADRRRRCIDFARQAIDLTVDLGSDFYSFHAGFLGTPEVGDLGRGWGRVKRVSYEEGLNLFAQAVAEVEEYASSRGVRLLVENNVLTTETSEENGSDILLMTTPEDIRHVHSVMPSSVLLLMDVGHLFVSATTLGFDPIRALWDLQDLIGAYHLSENNGLADINHPLRPDSWFWPGLKRDVAFFTIEVSPVHGVSLREQVTLTETTMAL